MKLAVKEDLDKYVRNHTRNTSNDPVVLNYLTRNLKKTKTATVRLVDLARMAEEGLNFYVSKSDIRAVLEQAGFEIVQQTHHYNSDCKLFFVKASLLKSSFKTR